MAQENGERYVLRNARHLAADYMMRTIREGDTVVDATMGNGKDTLFLCELVGESGHVYAFDVQAEAVERTRERVKEAGFEARTTLLLAGHETMKEYVPSGVRAVMFNLGWLPGAEHGVTTLRETTLQAADAALSLLKKDGLLSICIYPGHEEGQRELDALMDWAAQLDPKRYDALVKTYVNQPNCPPRLLAVRRVK